MAKWKKQAHVVYQCLYHLVWCPKYRFRILKGAVAKNVKHMLELLCEWKKVEIIEIAVMEDHVHMIVVIPPRMAVSELMGILKGKTAIKLFKIFPGLKERPYWGNRFWSRGYCVSTVGMDEQKIRRYVRYQEDKERREEADQRDFGLFERPR